MSRSNYVRPFSPKEFGPTAPNKRLSKDEAVDFDSVSIADSNASSYTERITVIPDNTMTGVGGQFHLAPGSRHSNRSMSPATPSPPASPNIPQRKRKTPPQSALSKTDSIRSQTPGEDTAEGIDHSRSLIPSFDALNLSQPAGTSSPPPTAAATNSVQVSPPAPAIKVG